MNRSGGRVPDSPCPIVPTRSAGHRRRNSYPAMRLNVAATAARGLEAPGEIYHDDGEQVLPQPGGFYDAG